MPTGSRCYDSEDRLINWNRADGNLNQAWDLSDVGNWDSLTTNSVTQNRSHSPANELTAINTNPLTHDTKGNLTADDQGRSFTWDADNHLASATKASVTSSYAYDALGRRVTKTTGTVTTVFVSLTQPMPPLGNLGGQIIAEYSAGAAASSPLRTYIFGEYVDEPLAVIDGSTTDIHYYHQNARFDVIALSSSTGGIVERCAYNAHGEPLIFDGAGATPRTASVFNNRFTFTGRELDLESGLYYFRARYFDARLGRFIGRDPIGYADGMSLYHAYLVPNTTDPSGTRAAYVEGQVRTDDTVYLIDYLFGYILKCKDAGGFEFDGPFDQSFNTSWRPESPGWVIGGHTTSNWIEASVKTSPVDCPCNKKGDLIFVDFTLVTIKHHWLGLGAALGPVYIGAVELKSWEDRYRNVVAQDSIVCCPK